MKNKLVGIIVGKEVLIMNLYEKLSVIQNTLKAPKGQRNSFGNYNYRSAEDILEAVKPILAENKVTLILTDEMELVGERYYIRATARLIDLESETSIEATAYARESFTKKGMDESQITGTASSYARKYAMNGLFNIDDTKDADTDEYKNQTTDKKESKRNALLKYIKDNNLDLNDIAKEYKLNAKSTVKEYEFVLKDLKGE